MATSNSKRALVLCLFQSLAGVIFGWGNSEGAGLFAMSEYKHRFGSCDADGVCSLSTTRQSAVTGLLSLGAMVGAISAGAISDRIGLRVTTMIFIFIHMVGAAIETSGVVYQQIYVARVLLGLGIGATSGLVPVFQAEAAPPAWRGLVTGSFQLCVTMGIWGVSMCGWGMSTHKGDAQWRVVSGIPMAFDLLLLLGFLVSPESPRFLAMKGRWDDCRKALAKLRHLPRDDPEVDNELVSVRQTAEEELERGNVSWKEVFSTKDRILWRVMIGVCVQIGQQITGINFFFSYGVQFAQTAGLSNDYIFQIILASVNVAMSFPGILLVERAGRRPVLLWGAGLMFVGQIVTGAVSKAYPNAKGAGDVLIAFCCIFVAAFAASWGPVAWVVCGESFPLRLSARCVTLGTGANWLFSLIIAFAAPQIQDRIGTGITFVWAGCLALDFLFTFFCIPETRGLSIEEIDAMYLSRVPAFKSGSWSHEQKTAVTDTENKYHHSEHADGSSDLTVGGHASERSSVTDGTVVHDGEHANKEKRSDGLEPVQI